MTVSNLFVGGLSILIVCEKPFSVLTFCPVLWSLPKPDTGNPAAFLAAPPPKSLSVSRDFLSANLSK